MYNLIIFLITIFLLMIVSLASSYYGGDGFNFVAIGLLVSALLVSLLCLAALLWGIQKVKGYIPDFWDGNEVRAKKRL